jgi:uncharacterized protein YeaO (DUF488 family)
MLTIYTSFKYAGDDALDISLRTQDSLGKIFAPSESLVSDFSDATEYKHHQREFMRRYSLEVAEKFATNKSHIDALFECDVVCFCCSCFDQRTCHRVIAARWLKRHGAEYGGEFDG